MRNELDRILADELARDEALARRKVERDGIVAFLDDRLPDVWDANYLRVDRPGIAVEEILAAGDETLGAAGLRHRAVFPLDERDGERIAAELGPRGWKVERAITMIHRRLPDRQPAFAADEVGQDEVDAARREFLGSNLAEWSGVDSIGEATVDQFLLRDRLLGAVGGDRWFVVREEGEVLAFCRLLVGDTAQVEDVGTLKRARGRGLARAVVHAAVGAARREGLRLVWLGADADDWPRELYGRLGFELAGGEVSLYRLP